jgi:O-antigen/teichoic acid export membrane protein
MLLKNTALFSVGEFASRAGKLLSVYVVAMAMAKSDFGTYAFVLSLSLVVVTLFDFGDNSLVLLRLTRSKFASLLSYFYLAKLTTTVCCSILVLVAYYFAGHVGGLYPAVLPAFLAFCVTWDVQTFLCNAQRARHDFAGEMWSKIIANFGFLAALLVVIALHTRISVSIALWVQALAFVIGIGFSFRRLHPYLPHILPPRRHAWRGVKAILRIGAPMTLAASVGVLQASIDSLVLGGSSHLDANASFTIAQRMAQMTYLPLGVLVSVALPYLSEGLQSGKRALDAKKLDQAFLSLVMAGAVIAQVFVLIGEWVIPHALGPRYGDVAQYNQVLALYIIPIYIFPVLTGLLWVMRVVVATQSLYGVSTLLSLILDIVAIQHFGPFAVVWVAVIVNWALVISFVLLYRLRIRSWPLRWPTVLVGLLGTVAIGIPRLIWSGVGVGESVLRALIALAFLIVLSVATWRRRIFLRNLAGHSGTPQ